MAEFMEARLKAVEERLQQRATLRVPPSRKLERFSGESKLKIEDWIEDANCVISSVPEEDRINFLTGHLEGIARDELRFADYADKNSVQKIFTLLRSVFGEKRTNAQLKAMLYDRVQKDGETVREYSRALLDLVDRMSDTREAKDKLLSEVFCENISDTYVRREMKKRLREEPTIKFAIVRQEAIRLAEDENPKSVRSSVRASVRSSVSQSVSQSVDEIDVETAALRVTNTNAQDSSFQNLQTMVQEMAKLQLEMGKRQDEMMKMLLSQQKTSGSYRRGQQGSGSRRNRSPPGGAFEGECWHCHQRGHQKFRCPELQEKKVRASGVTHADAGNEQHPLF